MLLLLTLRQQITKFTHLLQDELFPTIETEVGELSEPAKRLTTVLAMISLRRFVPVSQGWNGRPAKNRYAIACAYVAKVVYNFPDTRHLIERLQNDPQLRALCGWKREEVLPHESTFSRAFTEFASMELPQSCMRRSSATPSMVAWSAILRVTLPQSKCASGFPQRLSRRRKRST